jgi:hypothetical protein
MNNIKRISATQLSMADECLRKWWAFYVLKIKRPPPGPAAQLGSAHHKIMELSLRGKALGHDKWGNPFFYTKMAAKHFGLPPSDRARLSLMSENAIRCDWYEGAASGAKAEFELNYKIGDVGVIVKIDHLAQPASKRGACPAARSTAR